MSMPATVTRLCAEPGRGPGTDAERRAAIAMRDHLRDTGRSAALETGWVRPDWALAAAGHAALGVLGSLISVWEPAIGLGVLVAALLSLVGDLLGRWHWLARLTPLRATQNVVSTPTGTRAPVRLIVTANLDAGRVGAIRGELWSIPGARLRHALRGHLMSGLGALALVLLVLTGVAAARLAGASGRGIGALQFAPSALALLAFTALIDIVLSEISPGAGTNASGVAVALALVAALDAAPPHQLDVELVLAGAGQGQALGMAAFVRSRRGRRPEDTVVLSIEPCGSGRPCWLTRDGRLFPLRYHPVLAGLAGTVASAESHLGAQAVAAHGCAGAHPARRAHWPALAIGAVGPDGRRPYALTEGDTPEHVDEAAMRATLEFALALVAAVDAHLGSTAAAGVRDRAASAAVG